MDDVQTALVGALATRPGRARFVAELRASLEESTISEGQIETALSELEGAGTVIVRAHFCGDPHLEEADLRIAALVAEAGSDGDVQASAVLAIEAAWERWLGDYLASHRCT